MYPYRIDPLVVRIEGSAFVDAIDVKLEISEGVDSLPEIGNQEDSRCKKEDPAASMLIEPYP